MRLSSLLGLLPILGSAFAAPQDETFEALLSVPEGFTKVRAANPKTKLFLRIALEQPGQNTFEQALLDVSTPDNPKYGQHLEAAELKAMLKPRAASTDSVLSWLASSNVPAADIENDGEWINFHISVANANNMLRTTFDVYKHEIDSKEMIRTLSYTVPKEVAKHITMIQPTTRFSRQLAQRSTVKDIQDLAIASHDRKAPEVPKPITVEPVDPSCNNTITPACLRAIYNIGDYEAPAVKGAKLGVAGYLEQWAKYDDLATFEEMYAPWSIGDNFTVESINGGVNPQDDYTENDIEANLDIQYTVPIAVGVPVTYYTTGGRGPIVPDLDQPDPAEAQNEPYLDFFTYLLKLKNKELPQVITTSYGENEQSVPAPYVREVCKLIGQLGARGVSVIFSSGDTGVGSACQTNDGKNTTRFLPIFPAACPYVTSVGGTFGIAPERAVYFSSGGFSDLFPRPAYQDSAVKGYLKQLGSRWKGLYNPNGRGFPDVSAQAYRFHVIDKTQGPVQRDILVGGTSASAPFFASLISLISTTRMSKGLPPLGFLNPWIYQVGQKGFNDIVDGGSTGCSGEDIYSGLPTPFVPYASWNATSGWDPVTGMGTPNFKQLLDIAVPSHGWTPIKPGRGRGKGGNGKGDGGPNVGH